MQSELSFSTRDEFSRKLIAEKLINLLDSDIDLSPIVINGDWGTGKTEFCLKTIQEMKVSNEEIKCVYIDAFNADSSDEPILTLIAAIVSLFPDTEDKKSIIKKAIPVIKYASKVLLNAGTTFILKENAEKLGENLSEALKDQATTAIDATIDNLLDSHEKSTENIHALRSILESLSLHSPVIVFIDELDRCRPNYAIKMIESIKHIFNIKNVKFVLVSNLKQLSSSINKIYGDSIDADKYLDKFIGFKIDLPECHKENGNELYDNSMKYFSFLISENEKLEALSLPGYSKFISFLIKKHKLSLRDVERFVRYLLVYQKVGDGFISKDSVYGIVLYKIIGIFIYSECVDLKYKILNESYEVNDIFAFFDVQFNSSGEIIGESENRIVGEIIITLLYDAKKYREFEIHNPAIVSNLSKKWTANKEIILKGAHFFDDNRIMNVVKEAMYKLMLL